MSDKNDGPLFLICFSSPHGQPLKQVIGVRRDVRLGGPAEQDKNVGIVAKLSKKPQACQCLSSSDVTKSRGGEFLSEENTNEGKHRVG
jgi:hypothetical protein